MMHLQVELTGADISASIRRIEKAGIILSDLEKTGDFTIRFMIPFQFLRALRQIARKSGDEIRISDRRGMVWTAKRLLRRPVLLIGIALLLAVTLWVPGRVLFVQVSGNVTIPAQQIAETAAACGIHFGAARREVRSERMKNALLEAMPQLQWAGVNTNGCVAVITVHERKEVQPAEGTYGVSSIVAARDGVIQQITVLRGNRLCDVGQAVKAGQVLVSGYNDCGIFLQATCAEAEIYAQTGRKLTAQSPTDYSQRLQIIGSEKKFSLIIGKKRINFYNSSGILGTTCAKIYEQKYMTLPGGFVLPVSLVSETWVTYDQQTVQRVPDAEDMLNFSREYLCGQMIGGSILSERYVYTELSGVCRLDTFFSCCEMIGLSRPEEFLTEYESD